MEFAKVGAQPLIALGLGAALAIALPLALALIWKLRKKERFTTILVGAATFLIFALILEKPIQNAPQPVPDCPSGPAGAGGGAVPRRL